MNPKELLIALIGAQVCQRYIDADMLKDLSEEDLQALYKVASNQDLAHIAADALAAYSALGTSPVSEAFRNASLGAVGRYVQMNGEYERICQVLEEAKIPYIPLKGAVLRAYYPSPWMRTSCDIDILIKEAFLQHAVETLTEQLKYSKAERSPHDVSLYSPTGVHLELHFDLIEDFISPKQSRVLNDLWDNTIPAERYTYQMSMTDPMFYFYHIAHMAKHLENGGCGVRSFIDLWILNHCVAYDKEDREKLLAESGLLTFARSVEKLSEVWFSGTEADVLSLNLGNFIFDGGVYGTYKNAAAVKQTKTGGKLPYIWIKIFPSYDHMKSCYPVLQKHPWLTPLYYVVRWCKLLFKERRQQALCELKSNTGLSNEERQATALLMEQLGL